MGWEEGLVLMANNGIPPEGCVEECPLRLCIALAAASGRAPRPVANSNTQPEELYGNQPTR